MFKLDGYEDIVPSLWIWFYSAASNPDFALQSRELLIERLQDALLEIKA
jgi:hypothetical protein